MALASRYRIRFVYFVLIVLGAGRFACAGTVTLTAKDTGFVTEAGGSSKGDGTIVAPAAFNYSVGREVHYGSGFLFSSLAAMDRKNYFVFELTGIPGVITAATLKLWAPPGAYENTDDPAELFEIGATSDMAGALSDSVALAVGFSVGSDEFDDAGDPLITTSSALYSKLALGPALAGTAVTAADDGSFVSVPFSGAGVAYLNSFMGTPVILGGKVPTAIAPDTPQSLFGFTGPDIPMGDVLTPTLELTFAPAAVPEPRLAWLTGGALLLIFGWSSRQRLARRLNPE
ncbi:MAG: hypothetical protein KDA96_14660 [Planctomycetaceae bacterium]|nr:hypothetical protein [Planctomycetaceae bacterium]